MFFEEVHFLPTTELQTHLSDLEDTYAVLLKEEADIHTLNKVWQRIRAIKQELATR